MCEEKKTCVNILCGCTTIAAYAGQLLQLFSREVPQVIQYQCGYFRRCVGCSVCFSWQTWGNRVPYTSGKTESGSPSPSFGFFSRICTLEALISTDVRSMCCLSV